MLRKFIIAVATILFLMTCFVVLRGALDWGGKETPKGKVTVTIKQGASAGQIASELEEEGVIKSAFLFTVYLSFYQQANELKSGTYQVKPGQSYADLVKILKAGPQVKTVWVTIPEGLNLRQIADRLDKSGQLSGQVFEDLTRTTELYIEKFPFLPPGKNLEGFIFPDTYQILKSSNMESKLINFCLNRYQQITRAMNWDTVTGRKYTPYQILTIASMIEREAKLPEERQLISSVIYNRLNKGMPLQIDATVQYAFPEWKPRLLLRDLEINSPYNTYKNKGIPPGPISNPGAKSIEAALNPADAPYIYYVLVNENGKHAFAETYTEFLRAKSQAKVYFRSMSKNR